jgi:hypothetical protein
MEFMESKSNRTSFEFVKMLPAFPCLSLRSSSEKCVADKNDAFTKRELWLEMFSLESPLSCMEMSFSF